MQDKDFMDEPQHGRSRRKGAAKNAASRTAAAGTADSGDMLPDGRKRKTKSRPSNAFIRIRRLLILAVLEAAVLFGIRSYSYMLKQYNKIQRPDFKAKNVENTELSTEQIQTMKGYWNIAAFGVDSRNSSVGRGNNSDVIMVVSINRENGEIRIASVFRDSYLSLGNGSYNKINQAYAIGGPEQAVKALNQNLDLNITDYVTFNWKAVATGVNILGGVDVELTNAEFKYINSYITETVKGTGIGSVQLKSAGMNHLDGVQAVAYARLRYMDNDYTRTERQRKIIKLCVDKAKHADAQTLSDLAGNILSLVATSLTWEDGMSLALNVTKYSIADTVGFPMDRKEVNMGPKGACVLPNTLSSNVKQLHTFLFADEDYEVSKSVKEIDNRIATDESKYKGASSGRKTDSAGAGDDGEEETKSSGNKKTEGTESAGKASSATDENGKVTSTTEASGKKTTETGPDGEPLYDTEESDAEEEGGAVISNEAPGSGGTAGKVTPVPSESTAASGKTETTAASANQPVAPGQGTDDYVAEGPGHTAAAAATAASSSPVSSTTAASPSPVSSTTAASPSPVSSTTAASPSPVSSPTAASPVSSGNSSSAGPAAAQVEAIPQ